MSWSLLELIRNRPEILKESFRKRGVDASTIDRIVDLDKEWRSKLTEINKIRHEHRLISTAVARSPEPERQRKIEEAKALLSLLEKKEAELKAIEEQREALLYTLPNIVEDDVPVGGEDASKVIRASGTIKVFKGESQNAISQLGEHANEVTIEEIDWRPVGHSDMLENVLHLGNTLKAGEVTGSRFYYLFDDLVWLDLALLLYALDTVTQAGFVPVVPPYMLKGEVMSSVIDMDTFKDAIYKIDNEDLYLIATAEHPLAALHFKETLESDRLPLKLVGISPAFRKEAGAANKDTKGIFRVHQFHKVEQFIFSLPEDSKKFHQELLYNAESIIRGLGLPYRVINIASGDLGACASKKYDIEVWMPAQQRFRELVSCSNCLDWQAYRLKIRFVDRKNDRKGFVHTLNSTAIASTRTITAILENFQDREGVVEIPKVLRKYLEPFQRAPKDYIYPKKSLGV